MYKYMFNMEDEKHRAFQGPFFLKCLDGGSA